MQHKNSDYFDRIEAFIDYYYFQNGMSPTIIEISKGTSLSTATASRYIAKMCENGVLISNGHRNVRTKKIEKHINDYVEIPVWDDAFPESHDYFQSKSVKNICVSRNMLGKQDICLILNSAKKYKKYQIDLGDYLVIEKEVLPNDKCLADFMKDGCVELVEIDARGQEKYLDMDDLYYIGVVIKTLKNIL